MLNAIGFLSNVATDGVERRANNLCGSLVQAMVVAPIVIFATCSVLGWNEEHAVCRDKVIVEGRQKVKLIDCEQTQEEDGELVMLNCNIQKPNETLHPRGMFNHLSVVGTGLKTKTEMLQCTEKKEESGKGESKTTTYSYFVEWKEKAVDSSSFRLNSEEFKNACGATNPSWPKDVPRSDTQYAKDVKVGDFRVGKFARDVPLDTPIEGWEAPDDWTESGVGSFESSKYVQGGGMRNPQQIGLMRVTFTSNDWSNPEATVLGRNNHGRIQEWIGSSDWLCQGFDLGELRMGTKSKDVLFNELAEEETIRAWAFRVAGFIVLWIGFCCCLAPLGAAAECVPFVGNFFGGLVQNLVCIISCLPATALWLVVVGLCWLAMRPLYGCSALVLAGGLLVLMFHTMQQARKSREVQGHFQQLEDGLDRPLNMQMKQHPQALWQQPAPQLPVMQSMHAAQPVYAQAPTAFQVQSTDVRQMMVVVPPGSGPGSLVSVTTPDGEAKQVQVPAGVTAGQNFVMQY
mmetsp:Transcript_15893/g.29059  ORF Transcript_15893/g.29059 Transcript_15893/m.29059 type:complete len:515 (-) Transcript_15893:38-1582(-)